VTAAGNTGGVFLSYASQDSDAARRISDALRAAGIEVWLDQNELRGGDAWDQRIRRQVRECVLFLPVISSQTQSRQEGYFRLEWRLAVERMQRMSDGAAFLVPVVLDKTPEHSANVPEAFKSVQWARLPGGDTPRQFVDLIVSLIESTKADAAKDDATSAAHAAAPHVSSPSVRRKSRSAAWLAAASLVAVGVVAALYSYYRMSGADQPTSVTANASPPTALSIIVLPFANQTGDSQKGYVADALTSSITSSLVRIRDAYVVPAQTAYTYKDKALTVQQLAREAGVRFVLSGNVQAAGAQARIGVQLSGGASAGTLWNETFAGDLNDLFGMQDRITTLVANSLGREMVIATDRERGKLAEDAESADLLLRARALTLQNGALETQEQIEQIYRTVLAREPNSAAALAGLANALATAAVLGRYTPRSLERQQILVDEGEKLAERVREIAPDAFRVQRPFAIAALFRADFESAERIFTAMRDQAPLDPLCYVDLGGLAFAKYEPRKALEFFKRAADLYAGAPPDFLPLNIAIAYLELGEYDAAIENVEKALALNPRFDIAFALAAVAYSLRGKDAVAEIWAAKARAANVLASDVMGFPIGSEAYEMWADAILRPTWRKLGLAE
jgi:TolB-like protein